MMASINPVALARKLVGQPAGARAAAAALGLRARLQRESTAEAARTAADTLHWLGAREEAERVLDRAIRTATTDDAALLRCRVEAWRMSRTHRRLSPDRVQALVTRALARLDARWALGDTDVAEGLTDVLQLLYHGEIHLADQPSPLLDRDTDWVAPLRGSQLGRLLLAADASEPQPTSAERDGRRIGFVTHGSRTFLDPLVARLAGQGYQTRVLDVTEHPAILKQFSVKGLVNRRLAREQGETPALPGPFAELVEWADVVHAEWGNPTAAMLSMCDAPVRKVIRVHAFETRTLWMPIIDWRNIDQALFVSGALARMCQARYPAVAANPPALVSNISEFDRYLAPKASDANRTIAMVGWNSAVKDPAWCLAMFEVLYDADNSWRLQLIGHDMTAADDYSRAVLERIDRLGQAVQRVPFTRDIPAALTGVGVIVSSSLSESAHMAVAEGAASGALPVVRDWPALAAWGGPREIYPSEWVVDTAQQAADRILGFSGEERAQAGTRASAWVLSNLDAAAALPSYLNAYFPQEQHV